MVWIVALLGAWVGAGLLLLGLAVAAARGDRPTAEHLSRTEDPRVWTPPVAEPDVVRIHRRTRPRQRPPV